MNNYCELIFIDELETTKTCNRCLGTFDINFFNRKWKGYTKLCTVCLEHCSALRRTYNCVHDRQRYLCRDCHGPGICIHDRQRRTCRACDSSSFCPHNKQKYQCRACDGSSFCKHNKQRHQCRLCQSPKVVLIKNWLSNAKCGDIKYRRYDDNKFITRSFLSKEFDRCVSAGTKCWYCAKVMDLINYGPDLITLERLNNKDGHNVDNCVFACFRCNSKHKEYTFFMPQ